MMRAYRCALRAVAQLSDITVILLPPLHTLERLKRYGSSHNACYDALDFVAIARIAMVAIMIQGCESRDSHAASLLECE
jgi:hypothetical protein